MAKYCPGCGALIPDDATVFCPNCGGSIAASGNGANYAPQYQQPVQPAQPANPMYEPAPEPSYASNPAYTPKKDFPFKTTTFAGIAVVLAAIIVFVQPIRSFLSGYFIKTFKSNEDYFAFVEQEALSDYTDSFVNWYENYLEGLKNGDVSSETEFGIRLGETPKSLLASYTGLQEKDIDWINETKFRYTGNMKDGKMSYGMGLKIGSTDIASILAVLDTSDQVLLLAMKELTDDVLKVDVSEVMGSADFAASMESMRQFADALPDARKVRNLADKYFKIALKEANNSSVSDEDFSIGDISQTLTVIETKINEKFLYSAVLAVLKEAKDDKDIREIITDIENAAKETGMAATAGDTYSQFQQVAEALCEELEGQIDKLEGDGQEYAIWYDYVDSSHDIVGHKMAVQGQIVAEYVQLKDGKDLAFEAVVPNALNVKGSGTESSGKKNMTYDVEIVGVGNITVIQEDYKVDAAKKGELDGTIRILPDLNSFGMDLGQLIPDQYASLLKALKPELKLVFHVNKSEQAITLELLNDEALLVGFDTVSRIADGQAVSLPEGDVIDVNNEKQLQKFISGLKLDTLITNLEEAGVPSSLLSLLSQAAQTLENVA